MKVLIVCSGNAGYISPFVQEQVNSIAGFGNELIIYTIVGKGIAGYLKNIPYIRKKIKEFSPDLIHAHYGLSGLVSCLQRSVPVVVTFHGSDAYIFYVRQLAKIAAYLSVYNIFVEEKIKNRINRDKQNSVVPCGVELKTFYPIDKHIARNLAGLSDNKKYILFSSRFNNPVKNYELAKEAIGKIDEDIIIIELKNKSREEVNSLLNACDMVLLTSNSEGSPQFIKEAMACNCPIVATDVGDIKEVIGNTDGCYLTSFDSLALADKIKLAFEFVRTKGRTNGRKRVIELGLDSDTVAKKIINVYQNVLNQ